MNTSDSELLRQYLSEHSDRAFEELVQRYIDLIYSAALRQANGDAHLAEDVTQAVFTDLARKAPSLRRHTSLLGWLYTSTRFAAATARRNEQRRRNREQEAHQMNSILNAPEPEPDWSQIRPLLDEAMHTLDADDREAVLLRHFEKRSYAEIGERFALSDNAARMRVERGLQKLHAALHKRGVTSTALAIATLLSAHAVGVAPTQLAAKITRTLLAGAAATGTSVAILKLLALSKVQAAIAALVIAAAAIVVFHPTRAHSTDPKPGTAAQATTTNRVSDAVRPASRKTREQDSANTSASQLPSTKSILHLTILARETGKPVPSIAVNYSSRSDGKLQTDKLSANKFGICDVSYPTNATELELITRFDGLADTTLLWRPPNGDVIPTNYVLKLDPAVLIGGRVLDSNDNPIAGAKVRWSPVQEQGITKLPESHEFPWIYATTDQDGHWQINRIADDMIRRLYGSIRETNFIDPQGQFGRAIGKQLRDQTHVFHLQRGVVVRGIVVDPSGNPVSDAKVFVAQFGRKKGNTASDGTFSIAGCPPSKQLVSAEAPGFSPTIVESELADNSAPIRLTLRPGKNLRFRVVDTKGSPIAESYLDNILSSAMATIELRTDKEGRACWTNAPDGQLTFDIQASGFAGKKSVRVSADDEEHVITLSAGVAVSGKVRDETTGELLPHVRIIEGYPIWNPMENSTNAIWGRFDRFQLDFGNGTYSLNLVEPVSGEAKNPGWLLKFTADGHAPFVSRVIRPDEGSVRLDVALRPAKNILVTVYKPDGEPAIGADVGLVQPYALLALKHDGFSHRNNQSAAALLPTDSNGQFRLSSDDSITRVIVACPAGYAESPPNALSENAVMQLQPWGSLEVTCSRGGKPVVGRDYVLEFGGGSMNTVAFDFDMSQVATDAEGRFSVANLPPGKHNLMRIYRYKISENSGGFTSGDKTPFEIRPGETTRLDLGASESTVSARLQWPAGTERRPEWNISAYMYTWMPDIPPEVRGNGAAMRAYMQTPEYHVLQAKAHNYQMTLGPDGSLSADEVQPGEYELKVYVFVPGNDPRFAHVPGMPPDAKLIARATVHVSVPSDQPAGNIDAGVVELHAAQ